ncbi:hypothetical protein [Brachybacterium sacelli]
MVSTGQRTTHRMMLAGGGRDVFNGADRRGQLQRNSQGRPAEQADPA